MHTSYYVYIYQFVNNMFDCIIINDVFIVPLSRLYNLTNWTPKISHTAFDIYQILVTINK
jgi:hypothetical protein